MHLEVVVADAFASNCYLLAQQSDGGPCLVVDPGIGITDQVRQVIDEHGWTPAGVLLTHGHIDHVCSAPDLVSAYGTSAWIHADDAYRLDDPWGDLGPQLTAMANAQLGELVRSWRTPERTETVASGQELELAGLRLSFVHAPGHTEGSMLTLVEDLPDGIGPDTGMTGTILSGDVLFAGSVGRTDLPGGDGAAMARTLRDVIPAQEPTRLVLPGHGPATTIAHELGSNPFLQQR